jgi:hypothetical protein
MSPPWEGGIACCPEEQARALGSALSGNFLTFAHSRLTAFAARHKADDRLVRRAWKEFFEGDGRSSWSVRTMKAETIRIEAPFVLNPVDEAAWMSTNSAAQWGLAAIQNLALVGEYLPRV